MTKKASTNPYVSSTLEREDAAYQDYIETEAALEIQEQLQADLARDMRGHEDEPYYDKEL